MQNILCEFSIFITLKVFKIENFFLQESIDNNKSIGVTIYRCQIQAIPKKRKTFEVFKLIYFKKLPIKKVLIRLRVLSDDFVLIKCWFNKQAPQKVLIELSPGVFSISSKIMLTINIIRISKFINQSEWRCVNYPIRDCIIDMIDIDRQFIRRFWSHKIAFIIKGPRNIFFFFIYLRKLSRLRGKFFSTALVKDSVYVKYCSVLSNAVLEN